MALCNTIGKTQEEVRNQLKNHRFIFDLKPGQTVSDTIKYLDICNELELKSVMRDNEAVELYQLYGELINKRVSDKAKESFRKRHKNYKEFETPDNNRKKEAGIKIHAVLQGILEFYANKKGDIAKVKADAVSGKYAITEGGFNSLVNGAKDIIEQVNTIQDKINKLNNTNEKATFRFEQKVLDPVGDIGGALDVFVLFSDNTGAIIDYKTIQLSGPKVSYQGGMPVLKGDIASEDRIEGYNLTVSEYKRILLQRLGVKKIRLSRIVPIQIQLESKTKLERKPQDYFKEKIAHVKMGSDSEFLDQITVAGEATEYAGLNKLLNKQLIRAEKLRKSLDSKSLTKEEKQSIRHNIETIQRLVRKTIVKGEILGIIVHVKKLLRNFNTKTKEPQLLTSGEVNPNKLTIDEVRDFIDEMTVYNELVSNTFEYLQEVRETDPETYKIVIKELDVMLRPMQHSLEQAKMIQENFVIDFVPEQFKDAEGRLLPQLGLNAIGRTTLNLSEINHGLFIAFNTLKDKATYHHREDLRKFDEELEEKQTAVFRWGKENGYSRKEVFDLIINKETGNLLPTFKKEFFTLFEEAIKNEDVAALKKLYTHKFESKEKFAEHIKERRDNYIKYLKAQYNNLEATVSQDGKILESKEVVTRRYKNDLKIWDSKYNLIDNDEAWLNKQNYDYHTLVIKPELHETYYTDEYKNLKSKKPLFEFFNFFEKSVAEFRDILGVPHGHIPNNFIPNIRKSMIQQLTDNHSIVKPFRELIESFSVREEDVFISQYNDSTGEVNRQIPKLFISGFKDTNDKSFDLGKVLLLFANMTYNYKHMSELESQALALKDMLGDPSSVQGGELETDKVNKPIKGLLDDLLVKGDKKSETYRLLEDMIDYYLYGIKYKERSFIPGVNTTKILMNLKQYMSRKQLALAVIPGLGAYFAGNVTALLEGKKGQSYSTTSLKNSHKWQIQKRDWMLSIGGFFDVYSEDPSLRMASQLSINVLDKYTDDRYQFSPLRRTDEKLTDLVIGAMIQDWGVDTDGNLKNLTVARNKNDKSIKPISELIKVDPKTKKVTVERMGEDAFIAFRTAVKATMQNIIGNMSSEDVSRADLSLGLSLLFHFKTWMPGVLAERLKDLHYDERLQVARQGRYQAYGSSFRKTDTEIRDGITMATYLATIAIPNILKLAIDIPTFGLAPKLGLQRVDKDRAYRHYIMWKLKVEQTQPKLAEKITFEDYLELKHKQINAMVSELRTIVLFTAMMMILGGGAPDDKSRFRRMLEKVIGKTQSELSFMWSPTQMGQLLRNPIPISKLIIDFGKTVNNTFDETRDLLYGEDSSRDVTPPLYYSSQWVPGVLQMERFLELYDEYKKNPYAF